MVQLSAAERRALNVDPSRWAWLAPGAVRHSKGSSWPEPQPEQIIAHYHRAAGGAPFGQISQPEPSRGRSCLLVLLFLASILGATGVAPVAILSLQTGQPGTAFLAFAILAVIASLWGAHFATRHPKAPDVPPPAAALFLEAPSFPMPNMTFGSPGGIGTARTSFGVEEVAAGVRGEVATARLLEQLLEIPGVNVFHGLRFPGSSTADVDHAVVHGETVYLIDSKQYRPGLYSWGPGRDIVNASAGTRFPNHMAAARAGYEQILGGGVRVHAMVIIHGGGVSFGPRDVQDGVRVAGAQWALAYVGDSLLREHLSGWSEYDNSKIMGRLLQHLK